MGLFKRTNRESRSNSLLEAMGNESFIGTVLADTVAILVAMKGICKAVGIKPTGSNLTFVYNLYSKITQQHIQQFTANAATEDEEPAVADGWNLAETGKSRND